MWAWRAVGFGVAAAALAWTTPAVGATGPDAARGPEQVRLLDVPYVPQSGALCGGAALAMVLRYWGTPGVRAEDFAALLEPQQTGIRTGALVAAVAARGWTASRLPGTAAEVQAQLARGRPVIALLRTGAGTYHYVVVVAWANGRVVVHDPAVGPLRVVREAPFGAAWSGSDDWALLVLPPPGAGAGGAADATVIAVAPAVAPDGCGGLVEAGIALARQGDVAAAERRLLAAEARCPASAAPLRERAGLRFGAGDWAGASRLATRALALDPADTLARRLLAGSRYLAGDVAGALQAWNELSEPRADLTHIDGLGRTRFAAVADQLDLPPGRLLTPRDFRRAQRRLAELPAQAGFRLGLRPLPDGCAQLDVALLERPLVFAGPWDAGRTAIRALVGREVMLAAASPTGSGELWSASWRWWEDRPRVALALTVPGVGGRPGIWRVEGFWERQVYAPGVLPDAGGAARASVSREERRRTSLSFADWIGPDLRLAVGVALDDWADRGAHLALAGSAETRWAGDRCALEIAAARWARLGGGPPFGTAGLTARWCSAGLASGNAWRAEAGLSRATAAAPLALWSGAGAGYGREPLLRAHPLLSGGILEGPVFGRALVHGTLEKAAWPWMLGPLQLGWSIFVDGARPWDTGRAGREPWQVDGGAGLRLRGPGARGELRIDVARGFADGNAALSVGWRLP